MLALKRILIFVALLPVSFLFFAAAWLRIAPTYLYHCWDDCPPFVISWCPPFIHPWANSTDGKLRDYYLAPEWLVYAVWIAFIVGTLLLPAVFVWRAVRRDHEVNYAA